MTTPTPLDQQRQFLGDFLAVSKQRSERERAAQQQYATGEEAAKQQHIVDERAAQQNYGTTIKSTQNAQRALVSQLDGKVTTITTIRRQVRDQLSSLGVPSNELPPELNQASPRPVGQETDDPFAALGANARIIQQLGTSIDQLLKAKKQQQAMAVMPLVGAAVAVVILVTAGYFLFQRWNVEQKVAANRAALISELAAASREGRSAAVNPIDGATYVQVPAGELLMGSPEGVGESDEHPQRTIYLDAFWIMSTEVTNAQYAKCVAIGECSAPGNSRWQDPAYADHPVTSVVWNQANAYAQWAGGRLPTEAEWEKAARGTDGRTYPWGNRQPAQSLANCCNFVNDTTPVGSYPAGASPYGAMDMAGNVWEWTADWYESGYYSQSPAQNPIGPDNSEYRALKGGAYVNDAAVVRVASRNGRYPSVFSIYYSNSRR